MPVSLRFEGILELKEQLRTLPAQLKGQATAIVMENAYAAAEDIRSQYPLGPPGRRRKGEPITPGNLKKGVKVVVKEIGPLAIAAQSQIGSERTPGAVQERDPAELLGTCSKRVCEKQKVQPAGGSRNGNLCEGRRVRRPELQLGHSKA